MSDSILFVPRAGAIDGSLLVSLFDLLGQHGFVFLRPGFRPATAALVIRPPDLQFRRVPLPRVENERERSGALSVAMDEIAAAYSSWCTLSWDCRQFEVEGEPWRDLLDSFLALGPYRGNELLGGEVFAVRLTTVFADVRLHAILNQFDDLQGPGGLELNYGCFLISKADAILNLMRDVYSLLDCVFSALSRDEEWYFHTAAILDREIWSSIASDDLDPASWVTCDRSGDRLEIRESEIFERVSPETYSRLGVLAPKRFLASLPLLSRLREYLARRPQTSRHSPSL